jgi:hypothetical protein
MVLWCSTSSLVTNMPHVNQINEKVIKKNMGLVEQHNLTAYSRLLLTTITKEIRLK